MTQATDLVQIAQAEHCFHIVTCLTYNGAEVTGLRSSELSAISVKKRSVNLSVDSQSCLSPSSFGATEVTFRTGQHLPYAMVPSNEQ